MKRTMLKSKIHRAVVTDADLNYEGSISIDPALCEAADLVEFEKVDVYNCDNGNRFQTYVIWGKPGEICINGAAAHLAQLGQQVIIASFLNVKESKIDIFKPKLVLVNEDNSIKALKEPNIRRP
ncbi:MAG: aspartate 1-decarboxylase [Betaproteobacteria bacterium]|jgi:aspartate 1-decarboxylase|nr:aspartate 1-decarboxylase [Opitutales bacterium]MBT4386132.1 aspartate 1-decarboxylase [Betaproteobacteria bacterium]MDG2255828.1 aspartate 1-decarboxylase [Opitutaceae bacterium]MBT5168236.1 aspartate 1-decarboxylase [Opitutales bacterium]MBT5816679.1 aspartate 1-decarboxylase [Opitutales bacterium]